MKKQFFFIAVLLCCVFLTATAQEIVIRDIEGPSMICQCDLRDIMYVNHSSNSPSKVREYANPGEEVVNYRDRITNMPQYFHDFIDQYIEAGRTVLNGGSSWLSDPTLGEVDSKGYYHYLLKKITDSTPFTFPAGSDTETIKQAAADAYKDRLNEEFDVLQSFMPYAFLSVHFDHPEFFWIGSTNNYGCSSSYSVNNYSPSKGTGTVNYTIELKFYLRTNSYDFRNSGLDTYNFRNLTNLANGVQTFNNSVQNILAQCQTGTSRHDKLLTAHDWLTQHNCYNPFYPTYEQSQIGDTPWCAFSAIEGNNGQQAPVCEGYSRAFKVLCDAMGIPCIIMSGITNYKGKSEAHMWNYVQMENGKWYAIDVTWDDPRVSSNYNIISGHESHEWFLLGSTTNVDNGVTFIETHPEHWFNSYPSEGSYTWDLQPGPQLAPTVWSPTPLEKCATPTISYVDGKLKLSCETEGVQFFSTIKDDDIRTYNTEEIDLSVTYTISAYATKTGYENSDVVTGTLCWIDQLPNVEGIVAEDAIMEVKALPVLIQSQGGIITIQGASEGTPIAIYDTSGKKYGTTVAEKDNATIVTALCPGSVAIVKIGEKSVKLVIR